MSILDDLAGDVFAALSGELRTGTLRREIPGSGVDEFGDPLPGTVETYPFEGARDAYARDFAATAGIPGSDARLMILAASITVDPKPGDQVNFEGAWWQVRAIEAIDPAGATISLQVFDIEAPE